MSVEPPQISEREREILRLVARGATNQQIANELNISINTVKVHLRNIFSKIGAASRTEATMYAVRAGLVPLGEASAIAESQVAPLTAVADVPPIDEPPAEVDERADSGERVGLPDAPIVALADAPAAGARGRLRRWLLPGALALALLLAIGAALTAGLRPGVAPEATPTVEVRVPPPAQRWRDLAALPAGRAGFALAALNDDGRIYLYAIGGEVNGAVSDQVVRYDPSTNTWVSFSPKPTAVADVQAVVLGNKLYVPGGRLSSGAISDRFEVYDPQHDRWSVLAPLPQPRSGYALAAVEGKLYLFGGWDGSRYRGEVWQYNPDQDAWSERAALPTPRAFAGAVALEGQIYVVGGEDERGGLTVNERYTSAEDEPSGRPWATKAPLPAPRSRMGAAAVGELLFVFSGGPGPSLLYDRSLDAWQPLETPLGESLRDLRALAVGTRLYIVGGREADRALARAYEYQAVYNVFLPVIPQHED